MKMTKAQFKEAQDDNAGFCSQCDNITTSDIEPDAKNYQCPECGSMTVEGAENALVYGNIEITDDTPDDDEDDNIISISDDEDEGYF